MSFLICPKASNRAFITTSSIFFSMPFSAQVCLKPLLLALWNHSAKPFPIGCCVWRHSEAAQQFFNVAHCQVWCRGKKTTSARTLSSIIVKKLEFRRNKGRVSHCKVVQGLNSSWFCTLGANSHKKKVPYSLEMKLCLILNNYKISNAVQFILNNHPLSWIYFPSAILKKQNSPDTSARSHLACLPPCLVACISFYNESCLLLLNLFAEDANYGRNDNWEI